MRTTIFLVGFLVATSAQAEGIEIPCSGSPEQAILNVPKPADSFLHVLCTKFGHVLAPTVGWFWTQPGTFNPRFYPAQMVRDNPTEVGNTVYFKNITVTPLTGKAAEKKWELLAQIFPHDPAPQNALAVVAENNSGGRHEIYMFPNAWGYSCSPTCYKEYAFIMISQKKEPPQW